MKEILSSAWRRLARLFRPGKGTGLTRTQVGSRGERAAARHLEAKGYRILERNFRVTQGEIDLVAFRDGVVAFVEVRAQTEPGMIDPVRTITRRKQRRVIKAAQRYCVLRDVQRDGLSTRFDVVTVLLDAGGRASSVRHIEDAFQVSTRAF